jgi:hypothetical protein
MDFSIYTINFCLLYTRGGETDIFHFSKRHRVPKRLIWHTTSNFSHITNNFMFVHLEKAHSTGNTVIWASLEEVALKDLVKETIVYTTF